MSVLASTVQFYALSEIIASLSHALDMTEGQPPGHSLRTCAIGMRLGEELGLPAEQRSALYYALLLKDAGCSTNAAALAEHFESDDHRIKSDYKTTDWTRTADGARYVWRSVGHGQSWLQRVPLFLRIAFGREFDTRELMRVRCERGAGIATRLGFPAETSDAIRALDEHWDGEGQPFGLRGAEIPLLARIAGLAQTTEVFVSVYSLPTTLDMLRQRSGRWFDPELARRVQLWRNDVSWWKRLYGRGLAEYIEQIEPGERVRTLNDHGLDDIAHAFAEIIDAKSPFTYRHSSGVAGYARAIARKLGMSGTVVKRVSRAALLHDIGKLGISNRILDKPGVLTEVERSDVQRHPQYTLDILKRVRAFREFAWTAALHHERLDGSGYPWSLTADQIDQPARIIAVADVFEALTAPRPYRAGLPREQALAMLQHDAGSLLDADVVTALESAPDDEDRAA